MKEYEFSVDGKSPNATCGSWLPTDSNLLAVGYDSAHIAFFNYKTAKLEHFALIDDASAITCIASLDLNSFPFGFSQFFQVQCSTLTSSSATGAAASA